MNQITKDPEKKAAADELSLYLQFLREYEQYVAIYDVYLSKLQTKYPNKENIEKHMQDQEKIDYEKIRDETKRYCKLVYLRTKAMNQTLQKEQILKKEEIQKLDQKVKNILKNDVPERNELNEALQTYFKFTMSKIMTKILKTSDHILGEVYGK